MIIPQKHLCKLNRSLELAGYAPDTLLAAGQLLHIDVETLHQFVRDGRVNREAWKARVLKVPVRTQSVRVFGEGASLLHRDYGLDLALLLEKSFHDFQGDMLCSYPARITAADRAQLAHVHQHTFYE